jgi:hypothetical protein
VDWIHLAQDRNEGQGVDSNKPSYSSVGRALGYGLDGVLWFGSRRRLGIFLFITAFQTALGPIQPLIQWIPGDLSLGVKRPGREAYHSPTSNAEASAWSYTSTPPYVFMAWCLVQHRDNFTFTFTFYSIEGGRFINQLSDY